MRSARLRTTGRKAEGRNTKPTAPATTSPEIDGRDFLGSKKGKGKSSGAGSATDPVPAQPADRARHKNRKFEPSLRKESPAPPETTVEFVSSHTTHARACEILSQGEWASVDFCCYSFDVEAVVQCLGALGCRRRVLMDQKQALGRTKAQRQKAKLMANQGVTVRVSRGTSVADAYTKAGRTDVSAGRHISGIVHGKTFLATRPCGEVVVLLGSTNWTDCSVANVEFGAIIRRPDASFIAAWRLEWARGWESSSTIDEAEKDETIRCRSPSRSISRARN